MASKRKSKTAPGSTRRGKAASKRATPKKTAAKTTPKRAPRKTAPKTAPKAAKTSGAKLAGSTYSRASHVGSGGLGGLLLGAVATWLLFRKPSAPVATPAATVPPASLPPIIPPPVDDSIPEVFWDGAKKTVQSIDGYHRAKTSEVNKEAVAKSPTFLGNSIGTSFPFTTKDGTRYIAAVEEHTNGTAQNAAPHPHPGISIFIADKNA